MPHKQYNSAFEKKIRQFTIIYPNKSAVAVILIKKSRMLIAITPIDSMEFVSSNIVNEKTTKKSQKMH